MKKDIYTAVVAFRLPPEIKQQVFAKALKEGLSVQDIYQKLTEEYLKN